MNYRQFAQTFSLIALIVSPMIVLLTMQMPLWLPPGPVALERVVHADVVAIPWTDRDPASLSGPLTESWAETADWNLAPPF